MFKWIIKSLPRPKIIHQRNTLFPKTLFEVCLSIGFVWLLKDLCWLGTIDTFLQTCQSKCKLQSFILMEWCICLLITRDRGDRCYRLVVKVIFLCLRKLFAELLKIAKIQGHKLVASVFSLQILIRSAVSNLPTKIIRNSNILSGFIIKWGLDNRLLTVKSYSAI